uniref:Gag-pol polyprotein n=1 Tax=Loa loa TaxID=7209 RepID=A0A1I7VDJ2_LOALO
MTEVNDAEIMTEVNDAEIMTEVNDAGIMTEVNDAEIMTEVNNTKAIAEGRSINFVIWPRGKHPSIQPVHHLQHVQQLYLYRHNLSRLK